MVAVSSISHAMDAEIRASEFRCTPGTILTERLLLRPLQLADAPLLFDACCSDLSACAIRGNKIMPPLEPFPPSRHSSDMFLSSQAVHHDSSPSFPARVPVAHPLNSQPKNVAQPLCCRQSGIH
jgi:hypothetical protein